MATNVFQDSLHLFTRIGLKPQEARIYLTCLRHPEGLFTVQIVEKTQLNRSTVNLMVERLIAQGFLSRVKRGGRFQYVAVPGAQLLQRQETLVSDFRDMLPLLLRIGAQSEDTEVRFFEGASGIRQIWDYTLGELVISEGEGRELLNISSGHDVLRVFPTLERDFIRHRVRANIPGRFIAPELSRTAPAYDADPKFLRDARYFDHAKFPFNIDMAIFGRCIFIYSPLPPIGGMVMKNERIAKSMRSLFNMVWEFLV